jgi:hypothetical protein
MISVLATPEYVEQSTILEVAATVASILNRWHAQRVARATPTHLAAILECLLHRQVIHRHGSHPGGVGLDLLERVLGRGKRDECVTLWPVCGITTQQKVFI